MTDALCLRLVRKYGNEAKTILETDPYRIIREVKGIGFKTADRIALNLGLASNGPPRIEAGILHTMQECEDQGHTHFERREIVLQAIELLGANSDEVEARMNCLLEQSEVVESKPNWIQQPTTARAELTLAQSLKFCSRAIISSSILVDKAIDWAQQKAALNLLMHKPKHCNNPYPPKYPFSPEDPEQEKHNLQSVSFYSAGKEDQDLSYRTHWEGCQENVGKHISFCPNHSSSTKIRPSQGASV